MIRRSRRTHNPGRVVKDARVAVRAPRRVRVVERAGAGVFSVRWKEARHSLGWRCSLERCPLRRRRFVRRRETTLVQVEHVPPAHVEHWPAQGVSQQTLPMPSNHRPRRQVGADRDSSVHRHRVRALVRAPARSVSSTARSSAIEPEKVNKKRCLFRVVRYFCVCRLVLELTCAA